MKAIVFLQVSVVAVLLAPFSSGCGTDHMPRKTYPIPDVGTAALVEYSIQGSQVWHSVPRDRWSTVVECIGKNKKYESAGNAAGEMRDLPPFEYHVRIKRLDGSAVLLSFFAGDGLFSADQSTTLYSLDKPTDQRLRTALNIKQ
jgi:hypothetical protein